MDLVHVWFGAIAVLWMGFLLLEGFDFGVAALLPVLARTADDRRRVLGTIGPVWDGNEVWLITAVGATFAAFPGWYASWLSSTYLLFIVIVFALIARAVAVLCFSVVHGALFLSLKLHGHLRTRAMAVARRLAPPAAVPLLLWAGVLQLRNGAPASIALWVVAALAGPVAWWWLHAGRGGRAFAAWSVLLVAAIGAIFLAAWPIAVPSTVDPAFDVTAQSAAVSSYTLTVMTWVTAFGLPAVLVYQGWTYWVFRHRLELR